MPVKVSQLIQAVLVRDRKRHRSFNTFIFDVLDAKLLNLAIDDHELVLNFILLGTVLVSHDSHRFMDSIDLGLNDLTLLGEISLEPLLVFICVGNDLSHSVMQRVKRLTLHSGRFHSIFE